MSDDLNRPLVAIGIGNSTISAGYFSPAQGPVPWPLRQVSWAVETPPRLPLRELAPASSRPRFAIVSVNRAATKSIAEYLSREFPAATWQILVASDFPLQLDLPAPQRVGGDRLAAAVAANAIRSPRQSAIVIDAGTAITVDALDAGGVFLGGAILPGVELAARALCEGTDLLPHVRLESAGTPVPAVIGKATETAIRSGLYYGSIGAVREIVARLKLELSADPVLIVTGGWGQVLASELGVRHGFLPHLVLSGIAISARGDP